MLLRYFSVVLRPFRDARLFDLPLGGYPTDGNASLDFPGAGDHG